MTLFYLIAIILTVATCAVLTMERIYRIQHRSSVVMVASGTLLSAAILIVVPPVYNFVDSLMPVPNGADLVERTFAYLAVSLLGVHLSFAYKSPLATRLVAGKGGVIALVSTLALAFIAFNLTETTESSPQLVAYADQASVQFFNWITTAYVAYIVGPFVVPAFKDAKTNGLHLGRIASMLMAIGFLVSALRPFTYFFEIPLGLWYVGQTATTISTLLVVVGLGLYAYVQSRRIVGTERETSMLSID